MNVMSNGTPQQKLNWAFELVDVDGNGTADRDEVNQIISVSIYCNYVNMFTHLL